LFEKEKKKKRTSELKIFKTYFFVVSKGTFDLKMEIFHNSLPEILLLLLGKIWNFYEWCIKILAIEDGKFTILKSNGQL
jgi:hypothetical protein